MIAMPASFKVGDTQDCRINNGKAERLHWRDKDTLVIEPADARTILSAERVGKLIHFTCGGEGKGKGDYRWDGPVVYEVGPE
jgi:hypothetical protein